MSLHTALRTALHTAHTALHTALHTARRYPAERAAACSVLPGLLAHYHRSGDVQTVAMLAQTMLLHAQHARSMQQAAAVMAEKGTISGGSGGPLSLLNAAEM
jgi:hypothetical protein